MADQIILEHSESESSSLSPARESSSSPVAPVVERGRGRGRRRGRIGGRLGNRNVSRRGNRRTTAVVYGPHLPSREELNVLRREERAAQLTDRVNHMELNDLRELVKNICNRNPSIVLEIVDWESQRTLATQGGYHPAPDNNTPEWCICGRCRQMPTEEERLCCRQTPQNCLSTLPDFDLVVLDPLVLVIARRYRVDVLAAGEENDYNRNNRHAAYRQFILWTHGHLGAGNRRVIPSCCVWKIRDKFPQLWTI